MLEAKRLQQTAIYGAVQLVLRFEAPHNACMLTAATLNIWLVTCVLHTLV
jgi:hypothetical protein